MKPPPPPQQKEIFSENGEKNFQIGRKCMQFKNYNDAIEAFKKAVEIDPRIALGWNMLGLANVNVGKMKEAIEAFKRAIKEFPEMVDAYYNLGLIYKKENDYDSAASAFKNLVRVYPDDKRNWYDVMEQLLDMSKYEACVEVIYKSVQYFPGETGFWTNLSIPLRELGLHEESIKACNYAANVLGEYRLSQRNKAMSLWAMGKYDEAMRVIYFKLESKLNGKKFRELYQIFKKEAAEKGVNIKKKEELPKRTRYDVLVEIVKACEYGLSIVPNHADGLYRLGMAYRELGKNDLGIENLLKARMAIPKQAPYDLSLKPDAVSNALAGAYKEAGDYGNALIEARRTIELNPKSELSWKELAEIHILRGDFTHASQAIKQGLMINPQSYTILATRAKIYLAKKDYDKAIDTLEIVLEKAFDKWVYWNELGLIYKEMGELQEARKCFEKAIKWKSDYSPAVKNLVKISMELNK
jgi:tetratricopeptide (TPR) repeat protein